MFEPNNTDSLQFLAGSIGIFSALVYGFGFIHAKISAFRSFWKSLPVLLMALITWALSGPLLLIIALGLCALGDYFLSRSDRFFIAGLGAFLLGHLAYIAQFTQLGFDMTLGWPHILIAIYGIVFALYLWPKAHNLRGAVMVYILVIMAMTVTALALPDALGLIIIGALIFVISDSILAIRMFGVSNHSAKRALSMLVWATYILGQALIVSGGSVGL